MMSSAVEKFFETHKETLAEIGITGGTEINFSVLLIAVNFHQRLKKLEDRHDKEPSF